MKRLAVAFGLLFPGLLVTTAARAETLYVTDELVVDVYATSTLDGERLGVVRTADELEVMMREGEAAQVRLEDGTEGWVSVSYLQSEAPAVARLQELERENKKLRSAAREDAEGARKENAELRAALETAQRQLNELRAAAAPRAPRPADEIPIETVKPKKSPFGTAALLLLTAAAALGGGFAWGYQTLDRRIRRKFGGLKVH